MRSDGSKNNSILIKMESKTVLHGNGPFPSILNALDFFYPEGRMEHIRDKQSKLFIEYLPDLMGQGFVLFFKSIAETKSFYLSNHFKPSSAV